jgi:hypothetical protein
LIAFPLFHAIAEALKLEPFGGPEFNLHDNDEAIEAFLSEFVATALLMWAIFILNWELNFGSYHYIIKQTLTAVAIRALIEFFPTAGPAMNPVRPHCVESFSSAGPRETVWQYSFCFSLATDVIFFVPTSHCLVFVVVLFLVHVIYHRCLPPLGLSLVLAPNSITPMTLCTSTYSHGSSLVKVPRSTCCRQPWRFITTRVFRVLIGLSLFLLVALFTGYRPALRLF